MASQEKAETRRRRRVRILGLAVAFAAGAAAPPIARRGAARLLGEPPRPHLAVEAQASASAVTRRGWTSVLARTAREFTQDQIPAVAAGATFYALLAVFPAMAAFVSLYGLVADVGEARRQILSLAGVLPGGAITIIGQQLTRLGAADHGSLGVAFVVGLAVSILSANAGMKALIAGLNVAYEARETRRFVAINALSLGLTLGAIVFSVAAVGAVVTAPELMSRLGLGSAAGASLMKWPLLLAVAAASAGSTATGRRAAGRPGAAPRREPRWRRSAGWACPCSSPPMSRASATTTRPTGPSAR